jgi:hexosaminidase
MNLDLLPTPRQAVFEEGRIAVGPGSPRTLAPEVGSDSRAALDAWLQTGSGSAPVSLVREAALPPEGYRLRVSGEGVVLAASTEPGWAYGVVRLRQLGVRGLLRACRLEDSPALALRGFHLNFSLATLDFEGAARVLESMARWRLNTVLIEYVDRFPYARHAALAAPDRLEPGQVDALLEQARRLRLEVIPLHQCLGHVDFILARSAYAHLREEDQRRDQFCPLHPGSLALFRELADEFLERHPGIRYFHMGGDEARRLGTCPACEAEAARRGKGGLYVDFVTRAAAHLLARGVTPILWDDMLCKYPEVIAQMPREVVIMYWDYWTTQDPSALFVARPAGGLGVVADKTWQGPRLAELGETERKTLQHFARRKDLATELPPAFRDRFSSYLGPEYPQRIRAFPYLEYYQDLGFRVIGAPAGGSNTSVWHGLPDFPRYQDNIRTFCRRLSGAGSLGVVTTAWYSVPPEALMPGLMATGQFAWNPDAA